MSSQNQSSILHKFKDMLFSTMSSELLSSVDSFNAREDDVFLVSYPKSGTHWIVKVVENVPSAEITLTSPTELGDSSKFEELKDPSKSMKKITPFLGINVSEREINQIAWKPSFREMKTDAAKDNSGPNKTICALPQNRSLALRKGAMGDWINDFTSKQKRVFDEPFAERMKHSELARHFEDYS